MHDLHPLFELHLERSYQVTKMLLNSLYPEGSVMVTHKVQLVNKKQIFITDIELTPVRYYKKDSNTIIDEDNLLKEVEVNLND